MKSSIKTMVALLAAVISLTAARGADDRINVDLNKIEVEMMINPSEYRELLNRFVEGDTTMTNADMAKVYYGQGFTVNYDPNQTFPMISEAYRQGDYATVASLCEGAVDESPLSLDLIVMGIVSATRDTGNDNRALAAGLQRRLDMIVDTIIASGNGMSAAAPFYVASTEDLRQFLRNILGVSDIIDTSTVGNGDVEAYKILLPGSEREHILYFNNALQHRFDAANPQH